MKDQERPMPDGVREMRLVVTAPDYKASLAFYRDVLGMREIGASPIVG